MPSRAVLATLLLFAAAGDTPPGSGEAWMNEADLDHELSGLSVEGEYSNGDRFKESYNKDGSVAYEDNWRVSSGHWSIQAGTFCTIYDEDASGGCFRVRKVGVNCFEFYFVARTESDASSGRHKDPDWTARAWSEEQESSCKPRFSA